MFCRGCPWTWNGCIENWVLVSVEVACDCKGWFVFSMIIPNFRKVLWNYSQYNGTQLDIGWGWMIDSTRARNVWSSVALVEVRVMMAFRMSIGETLFVLHGVKRDCSGVASSCVQCCGFCFGGQHGHDKGCRWTCLLVSIICMQMFGSSCAPVTLLKALWLLFHFLKGLSVRMEQLQQLQAIESLNGVKGPCMLGWNESWILGWWRIWDV